MKKSLLILALIAALCSCAQKQTIAIDFSGPELTIYQIASFRTGCPEWVIKGIRFAESSYGTNCAHHDPLDIGDFGLHELPSYHAERAAKWGEYNPYCPLQSAIIAGHIVMENYRLLGDMDAAISAYCHGAGGTRARGIDWKYVARVIDGGIGRT